MIVEHTVLIARPVAEVYACLEDQRNATRWREGVSSIERVSPGQTLRGASFKEVGKGPMGPQTATYDVTEVVPNQRIEFQVTSGPMRPHGILLLAAANGGQATNLTYRLDTNARGLAKLMEKGFAKFLNDLIAKSAANVKAILEGTTVNVKGI